MNKKKMAYFSAIAFVLVMLMNFYSVTDNFTSIFTKQKQTIPSSSSSNHVQSPIAIQWPFNNETWETGTTHQIYWTAPVNSSSQSQYFNVYLCRNYFEVINIAMNIHCFPSGIVNYTMPLNVPAGDDNYQIEVVNSYNSSLYSYGFNFSITALPPTLSIISPNNQTWLSGSPYNIYWNSSGDISYVNLYLYSGGTYYSRIYWGLTNNGYYTWTIPSYVVANTSYQIEIVDTYNDSNYVYSDYFNIIAPSYYFNTTSPVANETWNTLSTYKISWNTTDPTSAVSIYLLYNNGTSIGNIEYDIKNNGSCSWEVPMYLKNGYYYLEFVDDNGKTMGDSQAFYVSSTTSNQNSSILGNLKNPVLILGAFVLGIIIIAAVVHSHRKRNRKINKVIPPSVGVKICPKCGSPVKPTSRFCTNCGSPMN